jgi:hypothetical protein
MIAAAFWIAHGDRYIAEAEKSAKSLQHHMPEVRRILITPGVNLDLHLGTGHFERKWPVFDHVIGVANPESGDAWYPFSIACFRWAAANLRAPLIEPTPDVLINLDVDTFVVQPFKDLLKVLERFDLVGTHAPARYTSRTVGPVPDAFCEVNLGMLAFRNSGKMGRVFAEWERRYQAHQYLYADNDQASLRETLWTTREDVRIWIAPPEYHFRFIFGGFARYPVKVLHGRSKRYEIEEVARRVNDPLGMRTWKKGEL